MRKLFLFHFVWVGLLFLSSCDTTIYLVRHAEKDLGVPNPHLTLAGQARARTLCDSMIDKRINLILSTDSNRTRETAQPTSARLGVPITVYRKDTIPQFVSSLKGMWGKNILLVTHSETIAPIVQEFGQTLTTPIGNSFNRYIIIKRHRGSNGSPTTTILIDGTYGLP